MSDIQRLTLEELIALNKKLREQTPMNVVIARENLLDRIAEQSEELADMCEKIRNFSDQIEDSVKQESYNEGYDQGSEDVREEAHDEGYTEGHKEGLDEGYELGYNDAKAGLEKQR